MSRWFVGAFLVSLVLACGSKAAPECGVGEGFVYVDVPAGAASVSAIEASGACLGDPSATCTTISAGCDGSTCDCKFLFLVSENSFASDQTCHLRATSPTGQVFARDVKITAPDARCFEPSSPFVILDFADAGVPDGGTSDADAEN
jgi:hypothetical protein